MTRQPEEDEELVPLPVDHRSPLPPDDGGPGGAEPERPGLDRRWRALGLGALLAILVGAGALSGIDGEKEPDRPADPPATRPGVPAERGSDEPAPEDWAPPSSTGRRSSTQPPTDGGASPNRS